MRVLLVNDYGVPAGGAERVTAELRDGLRARGHEVRLLASRATPFPLANDADYTCHGSNGWMRPFLQVANPSATLTLRRALAEFVPDIVHVRMFLTQLSPGILPLLAEVPAVLHLGNVQTICPLNTRLLPDGTPCTHRAGIACHRAGCVSLPGLARTVLQMRGVRRGLGSFRTIIANSHALADTLRAAGVPVDDVIWNGTGAVSPQGDLHDPPTLAYAGRLTPVKGLDDLIAAMPIVLAQVPGARLLVAGDGPDRLRIERQLASHQVGASVTMLGHLDRPRLDDALRGAWVHVTPSRYAEPFANTTIEAMMRGVAVVATATGGSPEVVQDGVTGYLVPPRAPAELADRLVRLLLDRGAAARMGSAGRRRAMQEFTADRMVERFATIYERVLHSALRRPGTSR